MKRPLLCLDAEGSLGIQGPQTGRSLDKAGSIFLVTSMPSLPLASSSVSSNTHLLSTARRCPLPHCNLSETRMGLIVKDVSEPRTLVMRHHPSQPPWWSLLAWSLCGVLPTVP